MIPKICHLYWDETPMPFLNTVTVKSFKKLNPDWEIIIYTTAQRGENIYTGDYKGRDYLYQIRDMVDIRKIDLNDFNIPTNIPSHQCSTMFRWQILKKYGGLYTDFDVIWLKPMDYLKDVDCQGNPEDFEAIVCFYEFYKGFNNQSIMIAEKESDYVSYVVSEQLEVKPPFTHQSFGTTLLNTLHPELKDIINKYPRLLALFYETFYPYSTYDLAPFFEKVDLSPLENKNVMAIHWFQGNRISIDFLNKGDYDKSCSVNKILKQEGYL